MREGDFAGSLLLEDERGSPFIIALLNSAKSGSAGGVIILCVIILCILLVVIACYFMVRFMHRSLGATEIKDPLASPYANVVMHPKRVYEIQAEEGCFPNSDYADDNQTSSTTVPKEEGRSSLRKPETGDLRTMREPSGGCDDPRQMIRHKEKKVHKDSVCAFLFRPQPAAV